MFRNIAIVLMLFFATVSNAANAETDHERKIAEGIGQLPWHFGDGIHAIQSANSTITTTVDEAFVQGEAARKFMRLVEGHDDLPADAIVLRVQGEQVDTTITYTFAKTGFLGMDDWESYIEPSEILATIKASTAASNNHKEAGYRKLFVDGWIDQPKLDKKNNIVYWSIAAHTDRGDRLINSRALKLGKQGAVVLNWMGTADQFTSTTLALQPALNAYQFDIGARYADFRPGIDTIAAFGVGALVYKTLTGSSKKLTTAAGAGLIAVALVFAKKLWFLVFLPFLWLGSWINKRFRS